MICVSCLRGFHEECLPGCNECHPEIQESQSLTIEHKEDRLAWSKDADNVRDRESTGRKRAAKLYPLDRTGPCEWRNASPENPKGGGKNPITKGCNGNQQCRHHGPDKDTLNNSEGNVHRICHSHHTLWHWANDESRQRVSEYLVEDH